MIFLITKISLIIENIDNKSILITLIFKVWKFNI